MTVVGRGSAEMGATYQPICGPVPVSAVLPVLNEAGNILAALDSISWAAEIFVVDSGSTDNTVDLAEAAGVTVVQFNYAGSLPKKKAWSLRNLPFRHEWVLYLDADERVPAALSHEIAAAIRASGADGYYVDREMVFLGRQLKSYRPDWNLRLFKHKAATIEDLGLHGVPGTGDNEIHEHFRVPGQVGFLSTALIHEHFRGIGPWIDRHNRYATWEAHLYLRWRAEPLSVRAMAVSDPVERNRALRRLWVRLPARPILRMLLWVVVKGGIRDGYAGIVYAALMGWYELLIGIKLHELRGRAK